MTYWNENKDQFKLSVTGDLLQAAVEITNNDPLLAHSMLTRHMN